MSGMGSSAMRRLCAGVCRRTIYRVARRSPPAGAARTGKRSEPAEQEQNQHDQQNQAETAGRVVTPARTVRPGRQCSDDEDHENDGDQKTGTHDVLLRESLSSVWEKPLPMGAWAAAQLPDASLL